MHWKFPRKFNWMTYTVCPLAYSNHRVYQNAKSFCSLRLSIPSNSSTSDYSTMKSAIALLTNTSGRMENHGNPMQKDNNSYWDRHPTAYCRQVEESNKDNAASTSQHGVFRIPKSCFGCKTHPGPCIEQWTLFWQSSDRFHLRAWMKSWYSPRRGIDAWAAEGLGWLFYGTLVSHWSLRNSSSSQTQSIIWDILFILTTWR